jgi:hypothetical protein
MNTVYCNLRCLSFRLVSRSADSSQEQAHLVPDEPNGTGVHGSHTFHPPSCYGGCWTGCGRLCAFSSPAARQSGELTGPHHFGAPVSRHVLARLPARDVTANLVFTSRCLVCSRLTKPRYLQDLARSGVQHAEIPDHSIVIHVCVIPLLSPLFCPTLCRSRHGPSLRYGVLDPASRPALAGLFNTYAVTSTSTSTPTSISASNADSTHLRPSPRVPATLCASASLSSSSNSLPLFVSRPSLLPHLLASTILSSETDHRNYGTRALDTCGFRE